MLINEHVSRRLRWTLAFTALLLFPACSSSSSKAGNWRKGNLHTHTLWSDGNGFPEVIASWYRDAGYDFLALSDHNILSRGEKWVTTAMVAQRGTATAIDEYRQQFGDDWVETRERNGKTEIRLKTLEEIRPLVESPDGFLMIESEEITDNFGRYPVHMNATNLAELIKPQGGSSVRDVMQRNLEAVEKQSQETGRPILLHLNHPNFGYAVTAEDLAAVIGERFYEVYNGHPGVRHLGDKNHASVERLWDIANTLRIALAKAPPLYGLGTDDSHNYHGIKDSISGRGWVMVRCDELEPNALVRAMQEGEFYASSGVTLRDVSFDGSVLRVDVEVEDGVDYTTEFIGSLEGVSLASTPVTDANGQPIMTTRRYSPELGQVLSSVKGPKAEYRMTGRELYVRAVVRSTRPVDFPVYAGQLCRAWTQPVGWRSRVVEPPKEFKE